MARVPARLPRWPPSAPLPITHPFPDRYSPIRRDLIKRHLYLVPNSIVVSRGCPHVCDFCYKEAFFQGGNSFDTQTVDDALAEIARLPGRRLYFLDVISSAIAALPKLSSTACAAWSAFGRRPERSTQSSLPVS